MEKYLKENQKLWDEWASFHPETEMYDIQSFLEGKNSLMPPELEALGDVRGKRLLHLQCHFGQDTLSWARMGAEATGVDFSEKAIETARMLNSQLGLNARFLQSDILDLKGKLEGQFDIIFTSYGVITWLPTLRPWAEAIRHYLRAGGSFFIVEFHPVFMLFDMETGKTAYPYFFEEDPIETEINGGSYAGNYEGGSSHKEYTWQHTLSDITMALLNAGLVLEEFREYDYSPYNCWPNMEEKAPGKFRSKLLPGVPHLFSLKMRG
ncbi:MAG: class I SAM-dependent methyltransferase [Lewinellaceae bacterium]|nr:class I SAM-dependent methyltransferase [Lewinellaceae bacterium]MCB9286932.1 class I SAM-dependent methyltransferase [Lewinellaceae bacterium]